MLNGIGVWRLRRPLQNLELVVLKPLDRALGRVLGVVVVLEGHGTLLQAVPADGFLQFVRQNATVEFGIEFLVYLGQVTGSVGRHAALSHEGTAAVLDRGLDMTWLELLTGLLPAPLAPIRPKAVDLGLVRSNDTLPVFNGPVLVALSEGQPVSDMTWPQKRLFLLDSRPQSGPSQRSPDRISTCLHLSGLLKVLDGLGRRIQLAGGDEPHDRSDMASVQAP
jgi:hypothetical protein